MELKGIQLNSGENVFVHGNTALLDRPKIGVLASRKCPAAKILEAHNQFKHYAGAGKTVVSGFHSPLEQECLRLLLRDGGNIVFCAARGLGKMRIKKEWREAIENGRMLIVSPFEANIDHITKARTDQRNRLVISLADELYTPYLQEGGTLDQLLRSTSDQM